MDSTVTKAEQIGQRFGRGWRRLVREEARVMRWMVGLGMPRLTADSTLWIVKLALFATLLYAAFWIAVVLGIVLIAATVAQHADQEERPHWLEKDPDDSCTMMAMNGSATAPLATSRFQMPLLMSQPTSVR